jgi:hypothetical protein
MPDAPGGALAGSTSARGRRRSCRGERSTFTHASVFGSTPQLVEIFLKRFFRPGQCVYDPFVGSGTTLVEANVFGADAIGCDISAFNCLVGRVKVTPYALGALEMSLNAALEEARHAGPARSDGASDWLKIGTRHKRWVSCSATTKSRPSGSTILPGTQPRSFSPVPPDRHG